MTANEKLQQMISAAPTTKEKLFYTALSLFAQKGYSNVGIRELTRTVHIKESSFYNHYPSKEALFEDIIDFFDHASRKVIMTQDEIHYFIQAGDVRTFFIQNIQRFSANTSNVLYHTAQQIVLTEAYFHPKAAQMTKHNLYHLRKGYTEKVLAGLMERGAIVPCDVQMVTAEYYYALKGILDEYLLLQLWDEDMTEIETRITNHIRFFTQMLKPHPMDGTL